MTIDPWQFTPYVVLPYVAVFPLMLRLYFRKDGSGNKKSEPDPFAPTALILAGVTLVVPGAFIAMRMAYIFIPYGSVLIGGAGLVFLGWAIWKQRRPPPPPVKSVVLRAEQQKRNAAGVRERPQRINLRRKRY